MLPTVAIVSILSSTCPSTMSVGSIDLIDDSMLACEIFAECFEYHCSACRTMVKVIKVAPRFRTLQASPQCCSIWMRNCSDRGSSPNHSATENEHSKMAHQTLRKYYFLQEVASML